MLDKYPNYVGEETKKEILEKGFSVYNYISLQELILTARKDFLEILSKINLPFWIITVLIWVISFYAENFIFLFLFLFFIYFLIFLIIFFKLIKKTYYFLFISDIVYTKSWIILGDKLYYYKKNSKELDKKLLKYENIFDEYLSKSSKLEEIINNKKIEILDKTKNYSIDFWWKVLENIESKEWLVLVLIWTLSLFLYIIFIYIFYYIWYFITFLLAKFYTFIIKIILFFRDKVEIKIKNITKKIDDKILKMNYINSSLLSKINEFKDWEISNIWNFIEKKFKLFYNNIYLINIEKKELEKIISKSKYKDFIDFLLFEKYLKKQFNNPIKNMISMLKKYEKYLEDWIKKIDKQKITKVEYLWQLWQKKIILQNNLNLIRANISKFEKSILK